MSHHGTEEGAVCGRNGYEGCIEFTKPSTAPTAEDISNALYSHLMGGAFDIGEAYLKLKCVGSCPSKDDFLAALMALAVAKERT